MKHLLSGAALTIGLCLSLGAFAQADSRTDMFISSPTTNVAVSKIGVGISYAVLKAGRVALSPAIIWNTSTNRVNPAAILSYQIGRCDLGIGARLRNAGTLNFQARNYTTVLTFGIKL